jgi:hypothetical protein
MRIYSDLEKQIIESGFAGEFWELLAEVLEDRIKDETDAQLAATTIERVMFHKTKRETLKEVLELHSHIKDRL